MRRSRILLPAFALAIAACSAPTARLQEPSSVESGLANTQWTLESFGAAGEGAPVVEGTTITLGFEAGGRAGGSSGCNTYGSNYKTEGSTLSFASVISTKRACADERANQQERRFFQALESAARFELRDDRLTILSADGRTGLTFVKSPSSSTEEPRDERPPAGQWMVTETGIGPVRVGMSVSEAREALGGSLTPLGPIEPCYYVRSEAAPSGVAFMVADGSIARVDVESQSVATSAEARVGDSEERIKMLYPGRIEVTPHKYTDGHYLTVTPADTAYRIIFETDGEKVVRYRAGRMPEVRWVEGCS